MGSCPSFATQMEHVFITHGHLDHVAAIPMHAQQRTFLSLSPAAYHLSPGLLPKMDHILQGFQALDPTRLKYSLKPVVGTEDIRLPGGVTVRPFATRHRVESTGYAFWKGTSVLKEEFRGLPSEAIRDKVRSGVEVKDTTESLEVVVTGDTTMVGLKEAPWCFDAKVLVTECTYADDEGGTPELARERGHMHLDDIVENAELFKNEHIILMVSAGEEISGDQHQPLASF